MVRYLTILCFAVLVASGLNAQDSIKTLSAEQVIQIVKQYHPVARQASILIEKTKANITIARGGFDPLLYSSLAQKTFDGIEYYKYNRQQLSIPTWFGIEVYTGLENLDGNRLNPTETGGETSYFGLSVPLAKNLLMDKRRAALQTAKIFRQASEIERKNILNNLLLDAMKSYWYWIQYYQIYKIIDDAVLVNEKRVELVKSVIRLGDRPAIDSTEALTQLQSFQVMREGAWMQFQNAGLGLSQFLWTLNDTPAKLPADVIPANEPSLQNIAQAELPALNELLDAALINHPELLLYNFKLKALDIEKRLKFQQLLPALNFRYNQLGKGYDILKTTTGPLFENNFQYGFSFGIPLRLSEGRGEYRMAKLKISETKLEQNLKLLQVEIKVKTYYNELAAVKRQVAVQQLAYQNYVRLQRAEEIRFQIGESSLFLINARENKTLEALQKLQELRTKYLITLNGLQWAAGTLIQ